MPPRPTLTRAHHPPPPPPTPQWQDALNSFKAKLGAGKELFGPLIRKYILDNQHRVTLTLLPDQVCVCVVGG